MKLDHAAEALERLASSEAFVLAGSIDPEMKARMRYAERVARGETPKAALAKVRKQFHREMGAGLIRQGLSLGEVESLYVNAHVVDGARREAAR